MAINNPLLIASFDRTVLDVELAIVITPELEQVTDDVVSADSIEFDDKPDIAVST